MKSRFLFCPNYKGEFSQQINLISFEFFANGKVKILCLEFIGEY